MANLLGVADVVLEQSRAPALAGGGDVLVTGAAGPVPTARYLLWGALGAPAFAPRVAAASPTSRASVYLVRDGKTTRLRARGGIPSLERALDDPETSRIEAWRDAPGDGAWTSPDPGDVYRSLDRFHDIPEAPGRAGSWSEWLYFNGQAGATRLYLTFLVGPMRENGRRVAGVRLQLDRGGRVENYGDVAEVDHAAVLATAPELTIGSSRVRIDGGRYVVTFDLSAAGQERGAPRAAGRPRAVGELILTPRRGQSLPPLTISGARGWVSGYVVPVMSGSLDGTITITGAGAGGGPPSPGLRRAGGPGTDVLSLAGGTGYHDHNWGFWEGVSWQWGQLQHDGLSILYGRVFPPADAADASRVPGFLMVLGPDGPLGQATDVTIDETNEPGAGHPRRIVVRGTSPSLDLEIDAAVESAIETPTSQGLFGGGLDFLQMRVRSRVTGRAGEQTLDFEAMGAAETFRGK
jgi:hypothetical protein